MSYLGQTCSLKQEGEVVSHEVEEGGRAPVGKSSSGAGVTSPELYTIGMCWSSAGGAVRGDAQSFAAIQQWQYLTLGLVPFNEGSPTDAGALFRGSLFPT
jgi:hypothetical protein